MWATAQTWKLDRAAIQTRLKRLNDPEAAADSRAIHGGFHQYRFELVPIDRINLPPAWHPTRSAPIEERIRAKKVLDPVRLSPQGGRYDIDDGIHRTNVAKALGLTHVPAIISTWVETPQDRVAPPPERPRLAIGDWVRMNAPEAGRTLGWVEERLGFRMERGVKRWLYNIALVRPGDDWPEFVDAIDTELEPVPTPSWGEDVRKSVRGT